MYDMPSSVFVRRRYDAESTHWRSEASDGETVVRYFQFTHSSHRNARCVLGGQLTDDSDWLPNPQLAVAEHVRAGADRLASGSVGRRPSRDASSSAVRWGIARGGADARRGLARDRTGSVCGWQRC